VIDAVFLKGRRFRDGIKATAQRDGSFITLKHGRTVEMDQQ
jgi:hypothetical protein